MAVNVYSWLLFYILYYSSETMTYSDDKNDDFATLCARNTGEESPVDFVRQSARGYCGNEITES